MADLERYEHAEDHDARDGASHTRYRRKPTAEGSAPRSKPAKISRRVAPTAPITRAIRRSREYRSGSYDVGYDESTAGSPTTDAATPATSLTDRTVTSKLAGNGLEELRLPSESSPGRLCASFSACSALTNVTDDTRGSAANRVLSAVTASEVASGAR